MTAPFGVRLDHPAVTTAFDAAWTDYSVVLVEASDLLRASAYSAAQPADERIATMHRALASTDVLVGQLLQRVNSARDAVLVVGPVRKTGEAALMVAALRAPGLQPGLLRSGTTQRAGYVQLMDVAPTVLDLVGVAQPDSMRGRPFAVTHAGTTPLQRRATLVDGTDAARFRAQTLVPVAMLFMALQLLVAIAAAVSLTDRAARVRRRSCHRWPWPRSAMSWRSTWRACSRSTSSALRCIGRSSSGSPPGSALPCGSARAGRSSTR